MTGRTRLDNIDALRGLAALAVAWGHIVMNNPRFIDGATTHEAIEYSARYGYLGVYAFYVISGLVIPLTMIHSKYTIGWTGTFLKKRFLRLQPPYLLSLALAILVAYAATKVPSYTGVPFSFSGLNVISHAFYLPGILEQPWLNPVYWSLLVEAEYYILIALTLPFLTSLSEKGRTLLLIAIAAVPFVLTDFSHITFHTPYFVIGLALCFRMTSHLSNRSTAAVIISSIVMLFFQRGEVQYAIVGAIMVPALLFQWKAPRALLWLGAISYSLYLVHYPISWRAVRLFQRYADQDWERLVVYPLALGLSLLAAIVFFWVIERPSLRWSSEVKIGNRLNRQAVSAETDARG